MPFLKLNHLTFYLCWICFSDFVSQCWYSLAQHKSNGLFVSLSHRWWLCCIFQNKLARAHCWTGQGCLWRVSHSSAWRCLNVRLTGPWKGGLYLCTMYHCCTLEGCLPSISTRSVYNAEYNDAPWMAASGRSVWVDSGSSRRVYSPSVFRIYGTTSHQLHKNTALPRWPTSTISTSTGLHQSGNISNASPFLPRCVKILIKHAHIYLNTSKSYSYSND